MYIFGTVATYTCTPGYGLSSTRNRTCIADNNRGAIGRFSGSEATCERELDDSYNEWNHSFIVTGIMCSALPSITNGKINYPSGSTAPYNYETRATYQCNHGHELTNGDSVNTCTGDGRSTVGEWNGAAPQCPRMF